MDVEIDKELPKALLCDGVRIKEILINLVGNALKFTKKGSIKVCVKALKVHDHLSKIDLEIRVRDTGVGIAKEAQKTIFEMFEQQSKQDVAKYGGTGLGLSISRKLAILMGGSLDVESKLGKGSTFILKLHHLDIASMDTQAQEENEIDTSDIDFNEAVILVADDVEQNRELVKESFAQTKVEVLEAINGEDAIQKVKESKVDLILMDIRMPVMDGYSATRFIKAGFDIPVVALTASIMQEEIQKIKNERFDGYLRKPVSKDELYAELAKFLMHTKKTTQKKKPQEIHIPNYEALQGFLEEIKNLEEAYSQAHLSHDLGVIENVGIRLLEKAKRFEIDFISAYAQELLDRIETFEIDAINSLIHQYPKNIELLKQKL